MAIVTRKEPRSFLPMAEARGFHSAQIQMNIDIPVLDAFLEKKRCTLCLPGLSVAVVQDGQVVYLRGLGLAGPGRAVQPETPFILGSLSKSFTALAIMQLTEIGSLRLDEPVCTYLPWFRVADQQASTAITVRQLMTHTSGISRYVGRDLLSRPHDISIEETVRALARIKLAHAPGQVYEYSNTNYSILGLLIEHASGESYEQYVQHHIFGPLAMKSSFTSEQAAAVAGLAVGYRWWFGVPRPFHAPYLRDALPAAFLVSNAQDMARWLLAHLHGGAVDGVSVLSLAGIEELHRPHVPTGKKGQFAAMGWRVGQIDGEPMLQHGGEVSNYRADMLLLPEHKVGLVVLANANNGAGAQLGLDQIAPNLARLLLGQPLERKRLTLRSFGLISVAASLVLVTLAIWLWVTLISAAHVTPSGFVAMSIAVLAPSLTLWRLPKLADMPWRGLRLYVPDLANLIWWLSIISLVLAGVSLLRWLL